MSRQQEKQEKQEKQEQEQIMNKLKTDILNMHKKIKLRGAYTPPLTPSVTGGVIGERSSRGAYTPPLTPSVKGGVIGERSPPTSTNYLNHAKLREEYRTILETAYNTINNQPTNDGKHRGKWHAEVLYQLMAHTRDIAHGYGERDLAYMQLFEWARVNVPLAKHALELFVNSNNGNNGNIGSWKDVKSFFAYMRRVINVRDDRDMQAYVEMTDFMVGMVNARLAADVLAFYSDDNENENENDNSTNSKCESVSLVSKWIPRENKSKKYGNLYERLACDYYKMWLPKDKSNNTLYDKAVLKCKIHYRKLISFFNRYLETPQIKMCEQNWANIDFDRVGRRAQKLQNAAFLNLNVDKQANQTSQTNQTGKNKDRETCADKYKTWKCDMLNYKRGISGNLVHHVTDIQYGLYHLESDKNAEWRAYLTQLETANTTNLKYMIPVLTGTSFRTVGLALAVAEKSVIGKKLITTTAINSKTRNDIEMYNLEDSFVKNVKNLRPYKSDNNNDKDKLDIYLSLIVVLQTMIDSGITPKQLKEYPQLTVVIFADRETDVSIGECETCDCMCKFNSAYNEAVRVYAEFGYAAPKILLWALKSESESELDSKHQLQYYSSGNILSRRVGCGESDIVRFLGIADTKDTNHQTQTQTQTKNQDSEKKCDEYVWHKEWKWLVNQLYNSKSNERHINFGRYFWKCI